MTDTTTLLLTAEELESLTGRKYPALQRRWLDQNGYRYEVGADGRNKLSRAYVETRLNGLQSRKTSPKLNFLDGQTAKT
jgi:hypothetical protein